MDMKEKAHHGFEDVYEDDDVFYAEVRKQILILIDDDEDDDYFSETRRFNPKPGHIGASKRSKQSFCSSLRPISYFNWCERDGTNEVPVWLANLWRSGHGTGVFIPSIIKSRRRRRPGGKNKERTRM